MAEWVRYRHRTHHYKGQPIEYDVLLSDTLRLPFQDGALYCRIRTVRNIAYKEEIHQPAYTWMPADKFFKLYERV